MNDYDRFKRERMHNVLDQLLNGKTSIDIQIPKKRVSILKRLLNALKRRRHLWP
jgi:hypothetical protein